MIDFEFEPQVVKQLKTYHGVAENMMRPISREYDEREHDKPWDFIEAMWAGQKARATSGDEAEGDSGGHKLRTLYTCLSSEELCWGDAGLFVSMANAGLGGAA